MARLHVEAWIEDRFGRRPLLLVLEQATTIDPARTPYAAHDELETALRTAAAGIHAQATELAMLDTHPERERATP